VQFSRKFSSYQHGCVVQALCEALKLVLEEYETFLTRFETEARLQRLSLQKLFAYSQDLRPKFDLMAQICVEIDKVCMLMFQMFII